MHRNLTNLHHANLLIGGREEASLYFKNFSIELGFQLANNPDFFAFNVDTFGIDEARQLKILSARRAINDKKFFLISPTSITLEAQNALLKTFEDPFPDTHFFLVVSEESMIIKTLLSRMVTIRVPGSRTSGKEEAERFISMPVKDRLLFSKKFVDEESNLVAFLDNLLLVLKDGDSKDLVHKVFNVRRLITETALLPRLALEHLSLVL